MSLLLGILTKHCVVVATDGYSIRPHPSGARVVERTDLQRAFVLSETSVLVHHGEGFWDGETMEKTAARLRQHLSTKKRSSFELDHLLFPGFDSQLLPLGSLLRRLRSGFGLWIAGYDNGPFLHELLWNNNLDFERRLFALDSIVWGGDGASFASSIFERDQFCKRPLGEFNVAQAQACIRELYQKSLELQKNAHGSNHQQMTITASGSFELQKNARLFGGDYQEVTITASGPSWSAGARATEEAACAAPRPQRGAPGRNRRHTQH